jgi:hypothetical protein
LNGIESINNRRDRDSRRENQSDTGIHVRLSKDSDGKAVARGASVRGSCPIAKCRGPLGALTLTLSIVIIEVALIGAMPLGGKFSPTLDHTMFAVLMIVLNAGVGLCLLLGGNWV